MATNCFKNNTLFYGDNLEILQKHFPNECIDLIYLDPPFNSKADYSILFKEPSGEQSTAQIQAFTDFWHWDFEAAHAYDRLAIKSPKRVSDIVIAMHDFLGKNDMFAYLVMMGERLLELHRVLKPTGSLYLHCDTTASHYLKLLLDAIFGLENFRNEIIWKRITAHSDAKRFGRVTDRIFFYSKTNKYLFKRLRWMRTEEYIKTKFRHVDKDGRRFRLDNLNPPGGRGPTYQFHGLTRPWRFTQEKMLELERKGFIYTKSRVPQIIRHLDVLNAQGGSAIHELWADIAPVNSMAKERMGFQTQKPIGLLERIINAGTNKGDFVLDPFCGCGTAIIAAEKLQRRWIGIDVTFLAINLVKNRIKDSFPTANFAVEGEPRDLGAAIALAQNRYQFQWWALSLIGARPVGSKETNPQEGKKGADQGVDGWLRFLGQSESNYAKVVVQVKSGHVGVKDIRELETVIARQRAVMGIFLTLEQPTSEMIKEAKTAKPYISSWNHEYPSIQILTIGQLLKGERPKTPPTINQFQDAPRIERAMKLSQQLPA